MISAAMMLCAGCLTWAQAAASSQRPQHSLWAKQGRWWASTPGSHAWTCASATASACGKPTKSESRARRIQGEPRFCPCLTQGTSAVGWPCRLRARNPPVLQPVFAPFRVYAACSGHIDALQPTPRRCTDLCWLEEWRIAARTLLAQ